MQLEERYTLKKSNPALKVFIYILLGVWAFINIFPIYFMFTFSLKSNEEIFGKNVVGLPKEWLWSNYTRVFGLGKKVDGKRFFFANGGIEKCFTNSLVIAIATIVICLVAALMATYAITRIVWRGREALNSIFMLGITIPMHVALYPIYASFSKMGILRS